ncbi:anti sigma factor C-terminal domain-containing protein [Streptococcus pacificus]|uniref:Anti sigma factor C-terminal domain-containing protein n=1 Tax=Streptococcus pacificus TaxID=2740577 RepID=A0ABS0ZHL4_9STRE|nr:anti sigma factor C-terminal domain-containing protein [Streptococcus pacificus]MBJ8325203.1 anti sigma factor C-terminal domain-containing protein [Streptococcus pacificus]
METIIFEKIVKKNKRRQFIKTVGASILAIFVLLIIGYKGLNELTKTHGEDIKDRYLLLSEIAYPNIDYSNWHFNVTSQFAGVFESHRYKNIDGIEVPFEPYQGYYSLGGNLDNNNDSEYLLEGDNGQSSYTHGSHYKVPRFYNINFNYNEDSYNQLTQDITYVSDLNGEAVEVAITFDKPYTYDEIKTMIPDNLMINWYWIGTTSDLDTVNFQPKDLFGMTDYQQIYKESKEVPFEEIYNSFIKYLKSGLYNQWISGNYSRENDSLEETEGNSNFTEEKMNTDKNNYFDVKEDVQNFISNNPDSKTAKFSGVILTGRSENFEALKNKEWIYASNIGQTVEIRPYHHLTK